MIINTINRELDTQTLIHKEQVKQLYAGSHLSQYSALINSVILAYFQWPVIDHQIIIGWLVCMWLITTGRLLLTWRFNHQPQDEPVMQSWLNYFLAGVFLSGLAWGGAGIFLFPVDDVAHQALLAIIMAGMSAGAVSVLSAYWRAVNLFLIPSLVPLSISFFSIANERFNVLAVVVIIFLFVMLSSAKKNNANILDSIVSRIKREAKKSLARSKEVFEDIVSNIPGVVYQFQINADGSRQFPYISPTVYDMLGIKAMDIVENAETIFALVHSDDRDNLESSILDSLGSMSRWKFEGRLLNKVTRDIVWFRVIAHPRKKESGATLWNGVLFDITAEKQTEKNLQAILDQMLDTFYRTDAQGRIVMVSPSVHELLGYTTDELMEMKLADLYVERDGRDKFLKYMQEHDGIATDYMAPIKHKDGHEVWVSTNAHYIFDGQGNVIGVEGVSRDITARREMMLELESHRQDLETLVEARARQLKNSEQKLNHLLKTSPVVIYTCKASGNFDATYCSDTIKDVFGYQPEDFTEIPDFWVDGIHPDDRERVFAELDPLFATGRHEHEYRFRMPDGTYLWIHDELRLLRDAKGEPEEIVGCWLDINDRKLAQEKLEHSEKRFRTLVDNVTDGIFVHGPDGRFIEVNKQACENLGYTRDELLQMSASDVEVSADLDALSVIWPELQNGSVVTVDGEHRRKDGSTFPVEVNLSMFTSAETPCVIALARDITQRKQAEDQLREINKELEAFGYSVSHDLRAPLRSVNGFCNILLDEYADDMDETARMYLERVVGASNKMSDLIDDLLSLSRLSRKEIVREKINLSRMVEACIHQQQSSEPSRQVDVAIQPDLFVMADKGLMNAVIDNLVSNAWKYTSRKESAKIEFFANKTDGQQVYCIRDNGAGFNMDYIDKLFLPFQRLHPENEFEGNGVGLATVQRIIHRHAGRVWAESEEGSGASFYFTLPNI